METQGTCYPTARPQRFFHGHLQLHWGQESRSRWRTLFLQCCRSISTRLDRKIQSRKGRLQLGISLDSRVFLTSGILGWRITQSYWQWARRIHKDCRGNKASSVHLICLHLRLYETRQGTYGFNKSPSRWLWMDSTHRLWTCAL